MKKYVCVIAALTALLAIFACVSGGSSQKRHEPDVKVAVFPQVGHTAGVTSVAFSPDGKYIVSGSYDNTIKLWDIETGRLIRNFSGNFYYILSVAFSPSGNQIISSSMDNTLKLWDVETGREIKTFSGHTEYVNSVAFSPDGKYVLSGSDDHTIILWDVETALIIKQYFGHTLGVTSVAFSPDKKYILSSSIDKTIILWDIETAEIISIISGNSCINSVIFSHDGKQILAGLEDKTVKLFDTETGREIRTFAGHSAWVKSIAFSPDGMYILSGSDDKTVMLWDIKTTQMIKQYSGHTQEVTSVAFSPDGKHILSGSDDKTLKLWDTKTGLEIKTFSSHSWVDSVKLSSDDKRILASSSDKTIKLWDSETGKEAKNHSKDLWFAGHSARITSVAFSLDGNLIVSGSMDRTLKLWEADTGKEIINFVGHSYWVNSVAFSPDGKYILSASSDYTFKLWETETGREIRTFAGHSAWVKSVAFSPNGLYIVSCSSDLTIKLWNAKTGDEIRNFTGHTADINSVVFSPDGNKILSGSFDGTLKLWDLETNAVKTFRHTGNVFSVAFSPDGKYVLSGSSDKTIKLWDAKTGIEIRTISGHTHFVNSVSFKSDGKQILSGSYDGTIRLWDVATGKEIVQFISFDDGEWICVTPEGYYNASPNGDKYLNVRFGNDVYGIEQYRKIFYRPNIVKAALSSDTVAYQKLVKEAGADIKNAVPPPRITIEPMKSAQVIKTPQTEITVSISDDNLEIKNVWINVNGRQVAGKSVSRDVVMPVSGLNVTGKDKKMYFTVPLDVNDGTNIVEVFATNSYNAEGRASISFNAEVRQQLPDLWLLAIGVNDYSSSKVLNLSYAVNDAKELVNVFKKQEGRCYGKVNTLVIADGERQKPTADVIRESFKWFKQAKNRDLCILFIAGHAVNDQDGNYYFLPTDAAFDEAGKIIPKTAISNKEIYSVLDIDMTGSKLFILDTCHSAGAGKSDTVDTNGFIRQAKEYNPVIFSSCQGSEKSLEKPEFKHGLFTYGIIKGMEGEAATRSGTVTIKSLDSYVSDIVSELSNGRQNPTTIKNDGLVNFILAGTQKK